MPRRKVGLSTPLPAEVETELPVPVAETAEEVEAAMDAGVAMTSAEHKRLTYIGPCGLFVDHESGLRWGHGETLVVDAKTATRLAQYRGKFECTSAGYDESLAVPPVQETREVTRGFEVN